MDLTTIPTAIEDAVSVSVSGIELPGIVDASARRPFKGLLFCFQSALNPTFVTEAGDIDHRNRSS